MATLKLKFKHHDVQADWTKFDTTIDVKHSYEFYKEMCEPLLQLHPAWVRAWVEEKVCSVGCERAEPLHPSADRYDFIARCVHSTDDDGKGSDFIVKAKSINARTGTCKTVVSQHYGKGHDMYAMGEFIPPLSDTRFWETLEK